MTGAHPFDTQYDEEPSQDESTIPLVRRNYENRKAAAHLRQKLRNRPPANISTEHGDLPDVEGLSIQNTPLSAYPSKSSTRDMSKSVTFSGKPSQLAPCLTHVTVKILADGITQEAQKCGVLASHLRGSALNWLTREARRKPALLSDYGELVAQLKKSFELDEEAQRLQAARRLASLAQKGSVQEYSQRFEELADEAGLNEETKIALFQKGLKSHVNRALIISNDSDTYANCVAEAVRIDNNLYHAESHRKNGRGGGTKPRQRGSKPNRGRDGKFVKQEEF